MNRLNEWTPQTYIDGRRQGSYRPCREQYIAGSHTGSFLPAPHILPAVHFHCQRQRVKRLGYKILTFPRQYTPPPQAPCVFIQIRLQDHDTDCCHGKLKCHRNSDPQMGERFPALHLQISFFPVSIPDTASLHIDGMRPLRQAGISRWQVRHLPPQLWKPRIMITIENHISEQMK